VKHRPRSDRRSAAPIDERSGRTPRVTLNGLLGLYHRLPAPIRALAAAGRGYQLRWWRYGAETDALVSEARERESWSGDQWAQWQAGRLATLLARAATRVPHYREVWRRCWSAGDSRSSSELMNWPILRKEALRQDPLAFVADDCNVRRMFHEHTSGTTGKPLDLWWSRDTVRGWYALFESRVRGWNGVSRSDRWAMIGGQLVTPVDRTRPPFWIWNPASHQLYLSGYHLGPETVESYIEALKRRQVRYLFGYASSMYHLAELARQRGVAAPTLDVAISNAEPLLVHQRETISEVFRCPVRDTYGMSEIVCGGSECPEGSLHVWPEAGHTEILEDGSDVAVKKGEVGRIVATGLMNLDMPLIRYETGDRGRFPEFQEDCPCGRRLPILASVEGRMDDVVVTADGRRIGRLDPVFKARLAVREAQIIQQTTTRFRVRVVPAPEFGEADKESIREGLRRRIGTDIEIEFESVDRIPRTSAGKFRAVISEIGRRAG
jgi:phenylacetate-CoA ligase